MEEFPGCISEPVKRRAILINKKAAARLSTLQEFQEGLTELAMTECDLAHSQEICLARTIFELPKSLVLQKI